MRRSFFIFIPMKLDYIIVGFGIAGMCFAEQLRKRKKSYIIFENNSQNSSLVAGGVYNPVVLKRFTPVWNAQEQLKYAIPFYDQIEKDFQKKYHDRFDILRLFKSVEEQNEWFSKSDHPALSPFMETKIIPNFSNKIKAPLGFGKLNQTGKIRIESLLQDYKNLLMQNDLLFEEDFNHRQIQFTEEVIFYENIEAKRIVFCEGYNVVKNPFFDYLPLQGLKGEVITIKAPELKLESLVKSSVFIMPLGDDLYKIGATFNWEDKTNRTTKEAKDELKEKLEDFVDVPYTIVEHRAGVRPTVSDRRPLVGKHPEYDNLFVFNGLGTRGIMIAPLLSEILYNFIENNQELSKEVDINRFRKKYLS